MTDEQIIEALATKIMGWTRTVESDYAWPVGEWADEDGPVFDADEDWDPLNNPADSKEVREKLAELGWCFALVYSREQTLFSFGVNRKRDEFICDADTEERAVALCALRTVGIDPTPSPQ